LDDRIDRGVRLDGNSIGWEPGSPTSTLGVSRGMWHRVLTACSAICDEQHIEERFTSLDRYQSIAHTIVQWLW